jgi:excinuclease ABC subunit A
MPDLSDKRPARRADSRVISIRGAREHNLKNVDVELPRDQLLSGDGDARAGTSFRHLPFVLQAVGSSIRSMPGRE